MFSLSSHCMCGEVNKKYSTFQPDFKSIVLYVYQWELFAAFKVLKSILRKKYIKVFEFQSSELVKFLF